MIADKIMDLRKRKSWSQEELAARLGVSRQSVSKWEAGGAMPDLEKIIRMSELFDVSTDYILKDESISHIPGQNARPEVDREPDFDGSFGSAEDAYNYIPPRKVTMEDARTFLRLTRQAAWPMAIAVSLCILSPVCLIGLTGLTEYGNLSFYEDQAAAIGVAILLAMIAAAAAVFVLQGLRLGKYDFLEKEPIALQYGVKTMVEAEKEAYAPTFAKFIAIGVVCCILAVVPLLLAAGFWRTDLSAVLCVCVLLILIAAGVNFFVRAAMIHDSFEKLLQEGEYTAESKRISRKTDWFPGAYWLTVVAIFLAWSFLTGDWDRTWIIWPVAGVLFAAICGIVRAIAARKW